ncbi:alkaline phosphatase [Shewanella sp. NIFS-20-20]|uniref:alkaline phosphatase n=1 Tax=Shewanella sp. NIFS-20-20 TaxID=2853806 RepID=UPI001C489A93|nr:alkaline phosphatase [Shewanella sp. NIFS-20-20]MBV7314071.1 alkaline phosphatase [Shewanella sp. NIFS-20-20]
MSVMIRLVGAWIAFTLLAPISQAQGLNQLPARPKNIIIMIGDGMGPAYTSAYRFYRDEPASEEVEETVFNRLLVGNASTFPAKVSGYVTDSAAAATALATGVKTYNGAISVDSNQQPLTTLFEQAKQRGMATGIAVTSQINHATPAAFLSHNPSRKNYDELAESYLQAGADVLLGGGLRYFPDALRAQFAAQGYQVLVSMDDLDKVNQGKVLGLFADVQLPWALDEPDGQRLSKMTAKALALLSQHSQGFVLLVEGSLIDWAGHNNDIAALLGEMHEFANAIEVAEQFVRQHPETLLVVTADHDTGGLTLGRDGLYQWDPSLLRALSMTPASLAQRLIAFQSSPELSWRDELASLWPTPLTAAQFTQLSNARMQGQQALERAINKLIDSQTHTGWTSVGHTGVDVQVFATGAGANVFNGHQDNTDIAIKLNSLLPVTAAKNPQ